MRCRSSRIFKQESTNDSHFQRDNQVFPGLTTARPDHGVAMGGQIPVLSPVSSAESGQYRTSRTPYLRDIMDCLSVHDSHRKIVFVKAAQIGGTEGASNFVGYAMHIAPAPTMFVQPTDKMVERLSKGRIDPLIENCPELKQRVAPAKSRDSNNTITQRIFPAVCC